MGIAPPEDMKFERAMRVYHESTCFGKSNRESSYIGTVGTRFSPSDNNAM